MQKQLAVPAAAVPWVIHAAFLCTVPIYAALLPLLARSAKPVVGLPAFAPYLLALVALVQIPFGLIVQRILSAPKPDDAEKGMTPQARRATALIIGDSAFEAIAVYGLVGVFLSTPAWLCYALMGVAFLALLANTIQLRSRTA